MDERHAVCLWIPSWRSAHSPRLTHWLRLTPSAFVALWQRPCQISISLKVSERDKHSMNKMYQSSWDKQGEDERTCWNDLDPSEKLPPLKHSGMDVGGWEDFDAPVLYFYAGLMPYVSRYVALLTLSSLCCPLVLTRYQGLASVALSPSE